METKKNKLRKKIDNINWTSAFVYKYIDDFPAFCVLVDGNWKLGRCAWKTHLVWLYSDSFSIYFQFLAFQLCLCVYIFFTFSDCFWKFFAVLFIFFLFPIVQCVEFQFFVFFFYLFCLFLLCFYLLFDASSRNFKRFSASVCSTFSFSSLLAFLLSFLLALTLPSSWRNQNWKD